MKLKYVLVCTNESTSRYGSMVHQGSEESCQDYFNESLRRSGYEVMSMIAWDRIERAFRGRHSVYFGAHTGRWSGEKGLNMQNLPRDVPGSDTVPREKEKR
jgi:hypothetical protein